MNQEYDQYHPNNDSDDSIGFQEFDDATYTSYATSINPNTNRPNKQKDAYNKLKLMDKGYRQITRYNNGKKVAIELYVTSQTPGVAIRDAVTGSRYNMKVGSFHEDAFFKVKDVSGELSRDYGVLYFETPKQAEKYLNITISDKEKEKWKEKHEIYYTRIEKQNTLNQ